MALSEIEKLERRYADNPQGLTFAPLAEVHRKNGDVSRALELLKPGLTLHPDYTPASIVLGRCHLDLGDLPAAEAAFSRVLSLDSENVIALKALADISERLHRFDDAERWLRQLLAVDRSNDEAREQLARVEEARSHTATVSADPEAGGPSLVSQPELESAGDASAEAFPSQAPESAAAPPAPPPPMFEPTPVPEFAKPAPLLLEDMEPSSISAAELEPPPEGLQVEEPPVIEEEVEPLSGIVGRDVDADTNLVDEFNVELSEDIVLESAGGGEFQVPDASQELFARTRDFSPFEEEAPLASASLEETEPEVTPAPEPAREPEPEPATTAPVDAKPVTAEAVTAEVVTAEAAPVPVEPEPVVTEAMAEVLLNQGHQTEALRVYRELENRSTGDPRFRQKIAELEAQTPPARRAYTAAETQGRPVREFLQDLLTARPPAMAAAPAAQSTPAIAPTSPATAGAPTRPAAEALSLSSVFGEETTPSPPAVPGAGTQEAGEVSFDEFFSAPGAAGAPRAARAPDPKSDDLDQFHAWLQNLKR